MTNLLRNLLGVASSLALIAAASGCWPDPAGLGGGAAVSTGVVGLALQVGPDIVITSANYAIVNGQTGFTGSGTVAVGDSANVPVPITGLPIADGYNIVVIAAAADGITDCRGSTGFNVRANSRSTVIVHLVCRQPPRTGSIQVGGTLNMCPLLDGLGASPDRVVVGGTASLSATAHDTDSGPQALRYTWTSTFGTFNNSAAAAPIFTCTQAGVATITAVVSDGDADPTCADRLNINVNCQVVP